MARSQPRRQIRPQLLFIALICIGACQGSPKNESPAANTKNTAAPEPAATTRPGEPRWRTRYALEERLRNDGDLDRVQATPLIEIIDDLRGDAQAIFAVHRNGPEPALRIEHWRLTTRSPGGLSITGESSPILRLRRRDPPAPDLQDLRVFAAIPGNKVLRRESKHRSVDALLASLTSAATTTRDAEASGALQVAALAELVADLDDTLVLERDVLYRVIDTFAGSPPEIRTREAKSTRRVRLVVVGVRGPRQIEALKLQGGWVLRDFRLIQETD